MDPFQPGENLIRASVHSPVRARVSLPPGDADREHRRTGRDPRQGPGTAGADEQARHLGSVPLELRRLIRSRSGQRAGLATDDVDATRDTAAQEGLSAIDPRVE